MGAPGKGVEHVRADCPNCGRLNVPGGVDHETGHIWLRRHLRATGGPWCSNKERVDAGPASPLLAAALAIAQRDKPAT